MITPEEINQAVAAAFPGSSGSSCVEVSPTSALVRIDLAGTNLRPGGFVPGPMQFAIADAALWYLTFGAIGRVELMALTSDLDITFLRPAHGSELWARADLLSAGSRKIVGAVTVWCDDRQEQPSAAAKGTYVLPRS